MALPIEQYSTDLEYVYTKDRPEMGHICTRKYISLSGYSYIELRGFFLEKELARMIVYQRAGTTNIINSPNWDRKTGKAEDVATDYFNAFKTLKTSAHEVTLGIDALESLHRGHDADHTRTNENLDYKLYDILKPSGLSYRVLYDLNTNERTWGVWGGLDRTQDNEDGNNPIIFSTKYKNIYKPNVIIDREDYKNACIVVHNSTNEKVSEITTEVFFNSDTEPTRFDMIHAQANKQDLSASDFIKALEAEANNRLHDTPIEINLEFDAMAGSYEYGEDFDLGDLCSVEIPDMGLTADVRLIGCYEVMKDGQWSMTMEFGTPMLK